MLRMRAVVQSFILMFLVGCQDATDHSSGGSRGKGDVPLGAVSSDGCMNVEKLMREVALLNPTLPALHVSTNVTVESQKTIRPAYRKALAHGAFIFEEQAVGAIDFYLPFRQIGCNEVALVDLDGTETPFEVSVAEPERIRFQTKDGRRFQYRWLGPERIEVTQRWSAYDLPCSESEIHVEQTRVIDWSSERFSELNATSIDRDYLALAASAVDLGPDALSATGGLVDQMRAIASRRMPPEIDVCPWAPPVPSRDPDESSETPDPSENEYPGTPPGEEESIPTEETNDSSDVIEPLPFDGDF